MVDDPAFIEFVKDEAFKLVEGKSRCLMPSEDWDKDFLAILQSQKLDRVDDKYTNEDIYRLAGCGGYGIRNWVAAFAARQAAEGKYNADLLYYRILPEWMTGMGILRAEAV